ncbi:hypothetical protein GCM10009733_049100 [Nonomuraea maheshkhaliensis]|uniref:Uncharacterized protein n=1 Tax=Nonomuraea maheshkhaliensis TaxID=419590 RepID=A0ABP4REU9_9ACTN
MLWFVRRSILQQPVHRVGRHHFLNLLQKPPYGERVEKTAIAYICESSGDLREILDDPAPLDAVLELARSGDADPDRMRAVLDTLHTALQQAGDVIGLYGGTDRGAFTVSSGGLGPVRRAEIVFHCPKGRCSRMVQPDPAATARPRCTLFDEDLAWTAI